MISPFLPFSRTIIPTDDGNSVEGFPISHFVYKHAKYIGPCCGAKRKDRISMHREAIKMSSKPCLGIVYSEFALYNWYQGRNGHPVCIVEYPPQ